MPKTLTERRNNSGEGQNTNVDVQNAARKRLYCEAPRWASQKKACAYVGLQTLSCVTTLAPWVLPLARGPLSAPGLHASSAPVPKTPRSSSQMPMWFQRRPIDGERLIFESPRGSRRSNLRIEPDCLGAPSSWPSRVLAEVSVHFAVWPDAGYLARMVRPC